MRSRPLGRTSRRPAEQIVAMSGERDGLDERDLAPTWLEQFRGWLEHATSSQLAEPTAMVLATADARGRPSARSVLLKGIDERGFVFYTNLASRKGRELAENPWASLVFPWYELGRQVVVTGSAEPLAEELSDAYFATRPYESQIGAHASRQSSVLAGRAELEAARADAEARYPPTGAVPRPREWAGTRVVPDGVEFWLGRPGRLHDRLRYRRERDDAWVIERLAP
jgi:pyridoxamine 5'-phosphate oxidase